VASLEAENLMGKWGYEGINKVRISEYETSLRR
jgi:hypothetical protein